MAATRFPGYKCPVKGCRGKFARPFGFRTGREFHVRTRHPEMFAQFQIERKEGRHGWDDFS